MTPLRLIILIIGLTLIVVIYIWESVKQRRQQRKQTVARVSPAPEVPAVRAASGHDADDYSGILSELNQTLADTKKSAVTSIPKITADWDEDNIPRRTPAGTRDMFTGHAAVAAGSSQNDRNIYDDINEDQIVTLHITALPTRAFNGNDILDAVNDVGLEHGDMNIFHHYGIGDMQSEKPLFSLADMFEPGHFDLKSLDQHNTRGLTLFFCLPAGVDSQVVFELMLNTAQRLAHRLGGEIRGPDHTLINDDQILEIRNKINLQTFA